MESVGHTPMFDEFAYNLRTRRLVYVLSVWNRPESFCTAPLAQLCEEFAGRSRASRCYQRVRSHHV